MKKFNGTDYDGLLPLAYNALNSQQLDGKTFNEIQNLFTSQSLFFYSRKYFGTGTKGESSPLIFSFPFKVLLFFAPSYIKKADWDDYYYLWGTSPIFANYFSTSYGGYTLSPYYGNTSKVQNIKISQDKKTIYLYSTDDAANQYNSQNLTYYFAAIGGYDMGGETEWVITQSGTWTVPKTGRYYIELYGGGGSSTFRSYYQGGSSCQSYDSISLTEGNVVNVTIGNGLNSAQSGTRGGTTTFGQYSVLGGEKGSDNAGGAGSGNKGTNGKYASSYGTINASIGKFGERYGWGVNGTSGGYTQGGDGAVYIKYLGA